MGCRSPDVVITYRDQSRSLSSAPMIYREVKSLARGVENTPTTCERSVEAKPLEHRT